MTRHFEPKPPAAWSVSPFKCDDLNGRECSYDANMFGANVVISERRDNRGMSVTNNAEQVCDAISHMMKRPVEGLVFFEHYPHDDGATVDRILLTPDRSRMRGAPWRASWRAATADELASLREWFPALNLPAPEGLENASQA